MYYDIKIPDKKTRPIYCYNYRYKNVSDVVEQYSAFHLPYIHIISSMIFILIIFLAFFFTGCEKNPVNGGETSYTNIIVLVEDESGNPISGVHVTTIPPTVETYTDSTGRAVLDSVLVREYRVIAVPPNYQAFIQDVALKANELQQVNFVLVTSPPQVSITQPVQNQFIPNTNITFSCSAVDIDDGELPDSVIVWYSDIDGELGRGKSILVDSISQGSHNIKVKVTDSSNKTSQDFIMITAFYYNAESYFPLPISANWRYRHLSTVFTVPNASGVTEYWTIDDTYVYIDSRQRRISTINYTIVVGLKSQIVRYKVIDNFEFADNNIYVTKTLEQITIWTDRAQTSSANEVMDIETIYTPRYLLLKNVFNPAATESPSGTTGASSSPTVYSAE